MTARPITALQVPIAGRRNWGPWRLDAAHRCLVHVDDGYEIDLDWCLDSAQILDWVAQVASKEWADNATIAGLVRALDDVRYLQGNVCGWAEDHRLTTDQVAQLVRRAASLDRWAEA